ncbi:transglycosylase SLT domain-containing protein [Pseudoalteromonas sp. SMS1]|uniref:transglycosylase SLT domain-containing protein n=1 Tax=Pseudoalteromonas sp. SMS1 TaxID=2908894 RepID=UPI001F22C233|nr:transglycosylase SLT domain-containing protein [Pseudoalteromonas sp. SMS1]MCF2857348.1 transglycosylase SLT domain-containing protein [Pseudoalteromonas sp. SMS1]
MNYSIYFMMKINAVQCVCLLTKKYALTVFACVTLTLMLSGCKQTQTQTASKKEVLNALLIEVSSASNPKPTLAVQAVAQPSIPKPFIEKDLWQHIALNLQFELSPHPRLKKRIDWYLSQPQYLIKVNTRAAPYLYHIVKKVEQQKLPLELALLPFVESDFRPHAVSKQHAVGAWQLVDATAYHFGLQSNDWYDGRKDVLAATDAALAYLKYLHKTFNGNWLHAIAAYNSGEGRVKSAIKKNRKARKNTHYWHLSLPKETSEYVPKLLALSYLLQHPETGFKRPTLPNQATTTILDVGQEFNFGILANLLQINKQQLHALNPGYLRHQSPTDGPHKVLVPLTEKALMQSAFYREQFSRRYTVKQNDTLYGIARRFSTSVNKIKQLNDKQSNLIIVGERILINQANIDRSLTVDYQISPYLQQQVPTQQATIEHHHTIESGDSLWELSLFYKVPLKDLLDWNNLQAASILSPGNVLILHLPAKQAPQPTQPLNTPSYLDKLENAVNSSEVPSSNVPNLPQ